MIGNDVVDLTLARTESNWRRKGFLDKIFTASEQKLILKASNQDEMVWMLWSLKESTYKAYTRIDFKRGFYPIQIEVKSLIKVNHQYFSKIFLFGHHFKGKTNIHSTIINSIVVCSHLKYKNIIEDYTNAIIKGKNALPLCEISNNLVSISHHGNFKKVVALKLEKK